MDAIKEYALGDDDITKILGHTSILTYPDLNDITDITQIFDKDGRCVLLFLTEDEQTGHWTGLLRNANTIEYFDPYGYAPDADRKWLSRDKLRELDQERPVLTKLLRDSGMKVYFNTYGFQADREDVNTCGRWVVSRLLLRKLTLPQFKKRVDDSGMKPDDFVSALTYKIIKR